MSDLVPLKPMGAVAKGSDLFERMMAETKKALGGGQSRRISIRGSRFRLMVGGEQVGKAKSTPLNAIIVRASGINRTYYQGTYDPENPTPPRCWSVDGTAPSPNVPKDQRMASKCASCKMNIKGSGQGQSRACRFSMRLAIMLEGDAEDNIYQMQIPATSIFGKREGSNMGFQAYVKYLAEMQNSHGTVVTQMEFDEDAETPKLFFKPVRTVDADEWNTVEELYDSEEVVDAVTMTVYQADEPKEIAIEDGDDDEEEAPAPTKRVSKPVEVAEDDEDDEDDVPAPKKRAAKSKPTPKDDDGDDPLLSAISGW